jgi:predicted enzyme related to lactoylglutathione lyase
MALVQQVVARVFVDDVDAALPLYEQLSDGAAARRFAFRDVRLAWVGSFLLVQAPVDQRDAYARVATLIVGDIDAARAVVESAGGTVLEGPADAPNGPRMIARHGDGAVFEYLEIAA